MAKFLMTELVPSRPPITARLGGGTGSSEHFGDSEVGKAVKYVGDSRYDHCVAGDPIEGFVNSVELATLDDYSIGSVQVGDRKVVTADGLEATPGTGTIAVGDFVVAGTMVAKDTALTDAAPQRVTKATVQPGDTVASYADVGSMVDLVTKGAWRVVSLGAGGVGTVDALILIERVY